MIKTPRDFFLYNFDFDDELVQEEWLQYVESLEQEVDDEDGE